MNKPNHETWTNLRDAAEELAAALGPHNARLELIEEMSAGRLRSRAARWIEEGAPGTLRDRNHRIQVENGVTEIPRDFWQRGHAWEEEITGGAMTPGTTADWTLLRFETTFQVEGGQPGWSDRWGVRKMDHGRHAWTWRRAAIGVSIETDAFRTILIGYGLTLVSGHRKSKRGYATADEPLIRLGLQMIRSGEAKSAHEAAVLLAPRAQGASIEARTTRLGKGIRAHLKRSSGMTD